MGKNLSFAERADRERRRARVNRIVSNVMFVVAGAFVALGVALIIVTGTTTPMITVSSGVIIASTGFMSRTTALQNLSNAARYDRLAKGGF